MTLSHHPHPHPHRQCRHQAAPRAQRGVTLIVVLLILVVVTIVGLGAAQLALLGERSTRYDRDYLIASQSAEAALMDAEFDIRGPNGSGTQRVSTFAPDNTGVYVAGCSTATATRGLCLTTDPAHPVWSTVDFMATGTSAPTVEFGEFTGREFSVGSGVRPALKPRYIIEQVADVDAGNDASASAAPLPKMYRVTAMGFGPRTDIQVVLQIALRK